MTLDPIPPPLAWLCHIQTFVHVGDYIQAMHTLAPNTPTTPSAETIMTLCHLHPLVEVDLPPFVEDFHPEMDLVLDRETFIYALTCSPHLSFGNPSSMVYGFLCDWFVLDDFISGFDFFWRYVGILLVVIFLHQYHAYLMHYNYWFCRKRVEGVWPIMII